MPRWGDARPKALCRAPGCEREAWAKDLCLMHYKRERRGADLTTRLVGDPDGHGQYGVLDIDDEGVLCHECGRRLQSLGGHVVGAHDMSARGYKLAHGLPLSKPMTAPAVREAASAGARSRVGTVGWSRLEAARDPVAAAHSRDEVAFSRPGSVAQKRGVEAVELGRSTRRDLVRSCLSCGVQWCPLPPRGYWRRTCSAQCWSEWQSTDRIAAERVNHERDEEVRAEHASGVSYRVLADRLGVTTVRIGQIVRADR